MPSTYAHKRFGELVFEKLPAQMQEKIEKHKTAFYLGLHGPDILFYYKPLSKNSNRKKGLDMHFAPAKNFFLPTAKTLVAQNEDPLETAAGAYAAGFICHFGLDDACHGDIYKLEDTGVSHGKIESEFDKYLLRENGLKIAGYNPAKHLNSENGTASAAALLLNESEDVLKSAIKTIRTINGMFVSRSYLFHGLAHLVLKIAKMDRKFGDMFLHKKDDPRCSECNVVLAQNMKNAVEPTAALVQEYFENLNQIAENGEMNKIFNKDFTGDKL
ncbi:MAG: zinc dependent phospholipase C family protein [Clostridia bacterium]|nr:zinc dependent phospholipase C family protein [Clostridia bacterium]